MSDLVKRLRAANTCLNEGDCCGQLDASGTCMAPACIFGEALKMAHEAANRIEQLEAALLTGVCMLSEMGLDPREKCQMAYDYMSAALGNVHSIGHKSGSCPRERT